MLGGQIHQKDARHQFVTDRIVLKNIGTGERVGIIHDEICRKKFTEVFLFIKQGIGPIYDTPELVLNTQVATGLNCMAVCLKNQIVHRGA